MTVTVHNALSADTLQCTAAQCIAPHRAMAQRHTMRPGRPHTGNDIIYNNAANLVAVNGTFCQAVPH